MADLSVLGYSALASDPAHRTWRLRPMVLPP